MANPSATATASRSATALVASCALIAAALASQAPSRAAAPRAAEPRAVPGELLVSYARGTTADARRALRERAGVTLKRKLLLPGVQLVRTTPGSSVQDAIAALAADPRVRYAEPNWLYELRSAPGDAACPADPRCPQDPRLADQWNLHNSGQIVEGVAGTAGADVSALAAWQTATGSRAVKVAVLDGGSFYHPDLAANSWHNPGEAVSGDVYNGRDDDGNGVADDLRGWDFIDDDPYVQGNEHGTTMAGVIGAVGDNGFGITGLNWEVSVVPLRVCPANCDEAALTDAAVYAGRIGAVAANMSFGGPGFGTALFQAIEAAPNTLFVGGAPNGSGDIGSEGDYPCEYELPNVVCVTATDNRDQLAGVHGAEAVDLAAPGESILAPDPYYREKFRDDFELATPRWDYDEQSAPADSSRWRRVLQTTSGGASTYVLDDSEQTSYPNNADTRVTLLEPIDLTGERGCFVTLDAAVRTESARDHLRVEAASSSAGPYTELTRMSGNTGGPRTMSALLNGFEGAGVYLRLRLTSDGANSDSGVTVDNVLVRCNDPETSYGYSSGTSNSVPHVTGAAALVKAHMPGLSVAELRERLLRTVDRLPSLEGKVVTGGRLNVHRALTADLTPPTTTIDSAPNSLTNSRSASFAFSSSKAVSTFECSLDSGEFLPCDSPQAYDELPEGEHSFAVRATDEFGIVGATEEAVWTVDATAPSVTITSAPPASTTARSATFSFAASEAADRFECSLDAAPFAACTSPAAYDGLRVGALSFAVRARDAAGNWSDATTYGWTITEPAADGDADGGGSGGGVETPDQGEQPPGDGTGDPDAGGEPDPPTGLQPPDVTDPGPTAWGAPRLQVRIRRQALARVLRRGFRTRSYVRGRCPCRIAQALRLNRRLARRVGLVASGRNRGRVGPSIGRTRLRLDDAGRARTTIRVNKRARKRLRRLRRVDGWLQTRVKDERGLATIVRQQLRIRR